MKRSTECNSRLKALRAIERTVEAARLKRTPPRAGAALLAAGAGLILLLVVGPPTGWGVLVALGGATGALYAVRKWAPLHASWSDRLDAQLSAYEPLNREAFGALQRCASAPGGLDLLRVTEWLAIERATVDPAAQHARPWRFAGRAL